MARREKNRKTPHNLPKYRKHFKRIENELNQQLLVILACVRIPGHSVHHSGAIPDTVPA